MQELTTHSEKTLIVGLGKTGLSCVRFLTHQGVDVAVTDSRDNPPGLEELRQNFPDIATFTGGFQPEVFSAAKRLVVSPGVPLNEPCIRTARQHGIEIIGDVELFARAVKAPVVAITGSNGKSTVTTLLGEMARQAGVRVAVGGNLGEPVLDLLADDVELYVIELSSFQLEATRSLRAEAAVVLNISPDHMDRYRDLEDYLETKAVIYQGAKAGLVNRDDPLVSALSSRIEQVTGFTLHTPQGSDFGVCDNEGVDWLCQGDRLLLPASELRIPGRHNLANALAALSLGSLVRLPMATMQNTLRSFPGLPHRTQFVSNKRQLRWYNDSKGTNVGATIAALQGLHSVSATSRTVLIAGGDCKGADFSKLGPVVEQTTRAVILIGRDAPMLEEALQGRSKLMHANSMDEAVDVAVSLAEPGDRVLLSPACASFDMYKNYEARGDAFIQAVGALAA